MPRHRPRSGRPTKAAPGRMRDIGAALKWYGKAAEGGDALGQFLLGRLYENGMLGKAASWYI